MAEQKAKLSKLCLTGFLISVLSPFALALCIWFLWRLETTIYWNIIGFMICLPFIGMIISIVGLVTARNKGRKGKGLGIAGIVLPSVYTAVAVFVFAAMVFMMKGGEKVSMETDQNSDVYCLEAAGMPVNTQYNVSRYRVPNEFDFDSPDAFASEAELSSYAESKLDEITDINSIRAKGTYQNYDFIIIRIDRFEQWVADDPLASFDYSNDGYAVVSYERTTSPFSSLPVQQLHMYKDPLDKFIIITNCNDNKVITDFF